MSAEGFGGGVTASGASIGCNAKVIVFESMTSHMQFRYQPRRTGYVVGYSSGFRVGRVSAALLQRYPVPPPEDV